jgi:KUP system potassium uptake protein
MHLERYMTKDLRGSRGTFRAWLENSVVTQHLISGLALFGVCFVLSDGILTPAQSVLGAIQGTTIINPDLTTWTGGQNSLLPPARLTLP